jgi:hypothetical protein
MRFAAVFALAVMLASAARAQRETFVVNPDASEVKMTLNTTHEVVNGTFHVQSGSIEFDRSGPGMCASSEGWHQPVGESPTGVKVQGPVA